MITNVVFDHLEKQLKSRDKGVLSYRRHTEKIDFLIGDRVFSVLSVNNVNFVLEASVPHAFDTYQEVTLLPERSNRRRNTYIKQSYHSYPIGSYRPFDGKKPDDIIIIPLSDPYSLHKTEFMIHRILSKMRSMVKISKYGKSNRVLLKEGIKEENLINYAINEYDQYVSKIKKTKKELR